jgi:protein translocase SecG subunit
MKETIIAVLPYLQIGLSVLLMAIILLQSSDASAGGVFGGSDNFSSSFHTRRGFEKVLFISGLVVTVLLVVSALADLSLK